MKPRTPSALLGILLCVMLLTGCIHASYDSGSADDVERLSGQSRLTSISSVTSESALISSNLSVSSEETPPVATSVASETAVTSDMPVTVITTVTTEAPLTTTATTTASPPVTTTAPIPTTPPLTSAPIVTQRPADTDLEIVSLPAPTKRGNQASMTVRGTPSALYTLEIKYKSGWSVANGLGAQTADADGLVTWSWKVGSRTTPGVWEIKITDASGDILYNESAFTVLE